MKKIISIMSRESSWETVSSDDDQNLRIETSLSEYETDSDDELIFKMEL